MIITSGPTSLLVLCWPSIKSTLLCKNKMQYLLTCKVSRYCLLALHGSQVMAVNGSCVLRRKNWIHNTIIITSGPTSLLVLCWPSIKSTLLCKNKMQYLLTCKVSRYCLLALHGSQVMAVNGSCVLRRKNWIHNTIIITSGPTSLLVLCWPSIKSTLLCKDKMQYLLTCKVSRYCLLALHGSQVMAVNGSCVPRRKIWKHNTIIITSGPTSLLVLCWPSIKSTLLCKDKMQYLLTCKVSRYCLLALHGSQVMAVNGSCVLRRKIWKLQSKAKVNIDINIQSTPLASWINYRPS